MAKIIQVTTFFYPVQGGVEKQVLELSEELTKQGHQVAVFCSDSTRSKKRIKEQESRIKNIRIKRFKTLFGFSQFYKIYPQLFFGLMKTDFDVIHVHGFRKFEIYPALLAAKLKRKKIILTTHNPFFTSTRNKLLQLFVNLHDITFGKIFTRFIDKIIVLIEDEIPFIKKFNVKQINISQIPNGIKNSDFQTGNASDFINKYDIPNSKFKYKVLWIGRLNKVKGLENLETAVKQLGDALFIFVGPDDDAALKYREMYHECKNTIFTGSIDSKEIKDALATTDILVLPSYHEAFGVVLLEAMAAGVPIISTNVGGPADIVKQSFGITQEPSDQWAWMLNIEKLLKKQKLRNQMKESAIKEAQKYKWENLIYQVLEVYGV
ncbi:glycosyltransferase family 4 protein [Patescibacteria group bacterium]